jgi:hypothetical protein
VARSGALALIAAGYAVRCGVLGVDMIEELALLGRLKGASGAELGDGGTPDALGDGASTIHMRWLRVAHSFATVCASEL